MVHLFVFKVLFKIVLFCYISSTNFYFCYTVLKMFTFVPCLSCLSLLTIRLLYSHQIPQGDAKWGPNGKCLSSNSSVQCPHQKVPRSYPCYTQYYFLHDHLSGTLCKWLWPGYHCGRKRTLQRSYLMCGTIKPPTVVKIFRA